MASRTWLGSSIESAVMACKATTHMHVCRSGLGREKPGIIEDVVGLWSEARRVRGRRFKFYPRRDRQISDVSHHRPVDDMFVAMHKFSFHSRVQTITKLHV